MQIPLTTRDIIWAGALAFFITWLILNVYNVIKVITKRPSEFDYRPKDINRIIQKCYGLFPKDIIQFHGKTFKRGMNVRVTTNQNKIFEGELIGLNSENMLCVLTKKYIVAHELDNIEEMSLVEKA